MFMRKINHMITPTVKVLQNCIIFRLLYQDFTYLLDCFIIFSKCWKMNALFLILKLLRSWQKRNRELEMKIFKKISRVKTSIAKLSDEIRFLNDAIHVQILDNPDNEMLLRNLSQCPPPPPLLNLRGRGLIDFGKLPNRGG